ncbi:hypothetical protein COCON_G00057400 [Conger conger]|uniref:Amyloid-beta A4 precursor protein-binding family A member 3 n=1 Tax=Conger conger TaxID=82655 RepID=A0A9Q1I2G1_CONCO|nr:hypothetical protein COCON_G00057400 [Conger conger]
MEEQEEAVCNGSEASSQGESSQPIRPVSPKTVPPDEVPLLTGDVMSESEDVDGKGPEGAPENILDQEQPSPPPPDIAGPKATSAEEEQLLQNLEEGPKTSYMDDLDSFNLIEPPPLDWRSDSSSDTASVGGMDDNGFLQPDMMDAPEDEPSRASATDLDVHGDTGDAAGNYTEDQGGVQMEQEEQQVHRNVYQDPGDMTGDYTEDQEGVGKEEEEEEQEEEEEEEEERQVHQNVHQDAGDTTGDYTEDQEGVGKEEEEEQEEEEEEEQQVHQNVHQDPGDTTGDYTEDQEGVGKEEEEQEEERRESRPGDVDHSHIQTLLTQLQHLKPTPLSKPPALAPSGPLSGPPSERGPTPPLEPDARTEHPEAEGHRQGSGLLFSERNQRDLLGLLDDGRVETPPLRASPARYSTHGGGVDAVVSVSYSHEDGERFWDHFANGQPGDGEDLTSPDDEVMEPVWLKREGGCPTEEEAAAAEIGDTDTETQLTYKDVPGPCDPEDLLDGVIFGAKYLGSTQLQTEKNPSTNARMTQAQEAVDRIKAPEGETQPMTEVDLFISTQRIKVLSADTQEAMMDHSLQMISYIADIGAVVVLMARRKQSARKGAEGADPPANRKKYCMICHVFSSEDAQIIAQAIGQAFGVAYRQFLQVNGIKATELRPGDYSDYLGTQEQYNGDLVHFSRSENIREVCIPKAAGEILGLAVVESGWGSILPTVVVANLLHGGPAERSGELSIGDRVMAVNGVSLVGLPIASCQSIIRDLKSQTEVKLRIVHCPPVTMAIIKRPDPKYQLGFSVEDGIICSLMRGGIAERGGIRVGHRIIEINGQSVVATPHEKIIHILTHAVGEIHLKTMPASTYRLLTGQEQPVFL